MTLQEFARLGLNADWTQTRHTMTYLVLLWTPKRTINHLFIYLFYYFININ